MKDTVTVRTLRPYEKLKLRRLKNERRNTVNSHHARIVLLSTGGVANRRIATLVDRSVQWVRQIIHRFNDHGLDGITWYPRKIAVLNASSPSIFASALPKSPCVRRSD